MEPTPVSTNFDIDDEDDTESWMIDTPEGNVVLAAVILLTLLALIGVLAAFYMFMRRTKCWTPQKQEKVEAAPKQWVVNDVSIMWLENSANLTRS